MNNVMVWILLNSILFFPEYKIDFYEEDVHGALATEASAAAAAAAASSPTPIPSGGKGGGQQRPLGLTPPRSLIHAVYWLMRVLCQSMISGAFLAPGLYLTHQMWYVTSSILYFCGRFFLDFTFPHSCHRIHAWNQHCHHGDIDN